MPGLDPLPRAFVALNRIFGAIALAGGLSLLAKCAWHLLSSEKRWSQEYFAVFFGVALVIVGIVYLKAELWRRPKDSGSEGSSQEH